MDIEGKACNGCDTWKPFDEANGPGGRKTTINSLIAYLGKQNRI